MPDRHFHLLHSACASGRASVEELISSVSRRSLAQAQDMASDMTCTDIGNLAKDCKAFYEKRLRLTSTVSSKWSKTADTDPAGGSEGGSASATASDCKHFSKLPSQIAQLRSELLSLAHMDNELFKNLLALNDKLEELKLQRSNIANDPVHSHSDEASESHTTEEYDDDDIDEEVLDTDDNETDMEDSVGFYSSLPPAQILQQASVQAAAAAAASTSSEPESHVPSSGTNANAGLDVIGGLKFMLRSRSFLLRPPFHKKSNTLTRTTPRRQARMANADSSSSSPFRWVQISK